MRSSYAAIGCIAAAVLLSGCFVKTEVFQGEVVSYDAAAQVVVVKDEKSPHGEMPFVVAGSELGADINPGDQVRIAYVKEDDRTRAVRVMNLTRQAEVGGKGSAGDH